VSRKLRQLGVTHKTQAQEGIGL